MENINKHANDNLTTDELRKILIEEMLETNLTLQCALPYALSRGDFNQSDKKRVEEVIRMLREGNKASCNAIFNN